MDTSAATQSPKLAQYLEELNALNEKYLYSIDAHMMTTPKGFTAIVVVLDRVPPRTPQVAPEPAPTGTPDGQPS